MQIQTIDIDIKGSKRNKDQEVNIYLEQSFVFQKASRNKHFANFKYSQRQVTIVNRVVVIIVSGNTTVIE